ncbi:MAG: hypothetical protein ACEPOZ_09795 [Marinifilaceae bacterium]|jgi:hypothetical protein
MGKKRCKLTNEEYDAKACKGGDFVCKKCKRIAKKVKRLCDPKKIKPQK